MLVIIWKYKVRHENLADFEAVYGPDGDWSVLFSRASGFLGVEFLRERDGSYLTVDRWDCDASFASFMTRNRGEYEELDRATEGWTLEEKLIGRFTLLSKASRGVC